MTIPTPLILIPASGQNPDIFGINSRDPNAGAWQAIVKDPLLPVGSNVLLQITSSRSTLTFQKWHVITAQDTPVTVAADFAAQIDADTVMKNWEVGGQHVVGTPLCAVSHRFDDNIAVTAAAWYPNGTQVPLDNGGSFVIKPGTQALDAGPVLCLNRFPEGWTPVAGSNIGQVQIGGPVTDTPGAVAAQYATISVNILNPTRANARGEMEFYSVGNVNGHLSVLKRWAYSHGIYLSDGNGQSLQDMGMGTVNALAYYINGRQVGVRSDGTLYLI